MLDASAWNTRLRIGVILASSWRARRGEAFVNWMRALLSVRPGVEVDVVDLQDYRLPPQEEVSLADREQSRFLEPLIRRWSAKVDELDGFVIVTPEYNQVYPGALKNAFDHAPDAWSYKPVAFLSYEGASAGVRAVEQLRAIAVGARMVPVRSELNVRLLSSRAHELNQPPDSLFAKVADAVIDQLLWWARTTKAGRASLAPPSARAELGG